MKVEIWSDIMCPFCYIGKRKFEAALSQVTFRDKIEVEWKSFLLNPEIVTDPSKSSLDYLAEIKNMSLEQAKQMTDQVAQMAAQSGLKFNFEKTVVANTRNAHRLIQMAKVHLLGDMAEEILFQAYFIEGKNMDDKDTLITLGKKIGLDEDEVRKMLESDLFEDKVRQEIYEAQQLGVRGVPFFVIDNKFGISGAQPEQVFVDALYKALGEKEGASE
ncbi:DsbA family oxidoreductase, partial [Anditalea andensis]|uniref:DsbA family oxidoreductase n=1 Tax=Anditalea andensis TaxID=1048983 RepID=UPI000556DEA2